MEKIVQRVSRHDFEKIAPGVVQALRALGDAVDQSSLEKPLIELVKVRASQINGCAFCLQFHLHAARRVAVDPAKLDLAAVWRDAALYSARERAALAWTEALTGMASAPVSERVYSELAAHFSDDEIAFLTSSIASINAWNRIAGGLQFAPVTPYSARVSASEAQ